MTPSMADNIEAGVWRLWHLLDALVDATDELPCDRTGMDKSARTSTLARIARDLCKEVAGDVAKMHSAA